jgi:hypothetical protein
MWRVEGRSWSELWEHHQPYLRLLLCSTLSINCGFLFPESLVKCCNLLNPLPHEAALAVYRVLESGEPWQQELPPSPPLELRALLFVFVTHLRSKRGTTLSKFRAELVVNDGAWYAEALAWNPPPLREWKRPPWHAALLVRYLYLQFDEFMADMSLRYAWSARSKKRKDMKAPESALHFRWQARGGAYYVELIQHFVSHMHLDPNAVDWMRASWSQGRFIRCYFGNAFYRRCVTDNAEPQVLVKWLVGVARVN